METLEDQLLVGGGGGNLQESGPTSELFNVRESGANNEDGKPEMTDEELQAFYQQLLMQQQAAAANGGDPSQQQAAAEALYNTVKPTPGLCIKTKNKKNGEKIFINICTSSTVPMPKVISEKDLLEMLDKLGDSDEVIDYRVPMSLGEPHAEVDNRGNGCTAYDVIINPNYLHTINNSKIFFGFLMSIIMEGILHKYELELEKNWTLLKNKKFLGRIDEQNLRKKTLIQEISSSSGDPGATSVTENVKRPRCEIVQEPDEGHPEFLVAEIRLPGIKNANSVMVDVGEDRLVVCTRPKLFKLDVFLPFDLVQEDCGSQFNVSSSILTVTMPVQPVS